MRRKKSTGFTLIELLVVIAIIGLLIALLLPALGQVMEVSRGAKCRSNLKQFGVALKAYHSSWNAFPPGFVFAVPPVQNLPDALALDFGPNLGFRQNGLSSLLDYFDLASLKGLYNTDRNWWAQEVTVASTVVEIFLCPSSDGSTHLEPLAARLNEVVGDEAKAGLALFAPTHYVLNKGVTDAWCLPFLREVATDVLGPQVAAAYFTGKTAQTPPDERGVFDTNSMVRETDIQDGKTTTFMVGEAASGKNWILCSDSGSAQSGPYIGVRGGQQRCGNPFTDPPIPGEGAKYSSSASGAGMSPNTPVYARQAWIVGGVLPESIEDTILLTSNLASTTYPLNYKPIPSSYVYLDISTVNIPSIMELTNCRSIYDPGSDPSLGHNPRRALNNSRFGRTSNFRSDHPGGGYFLMVDGSVQWINDSIDITIYRGLSSIAGGEVVDY